MISKLKSNSGSALLWALVLGVMGLIFGYGIVSSTMQHMSITRKGITESLVMDTAHSLAALIKQDLLINFNDYKAQAGSWGANCGTSGTVTEFLTALNAPVGACKLVTFTWKYFKTQPGNSTTVALDNFKTTAITVADPYKMNRFNPTIKINAFNLDSARNQAIADLTLNAGSMANKITKNLRIIVDVKRTIASPLRDPSCRICRTIAGSVCCGMLHLSFLGSDAYIWDVYYDENSGKFVVKHSTSDTTQYPQAISVKNPGASSLVYKTNSFILPFSPPACIMYILDAATDDKNNTYYLTVHGDLRNNIDGGKIWATPDPKFISLAFDNFTWYLLRSDGAIFRGTDITAGPDTFSRVGDVTVSIPTAVAIVTGLGPDPVTTCP